MGITILAVGTRMPAWVVEGVDTYMRRMPPQLQIEVGEIPLGQRPARGNSDAARDKEAGQLLKRAQRFDVAIALDETGKEWSSAELSHKMRDWLDRSASVALMIGGPDGLTTECRQRADAVWSLSRLTLPHGLVRVILAEQLYRAWTILQGHPYHRE